MQPYRTAVDAAGNLFIVDFGHNRVRKVNTSGVITTVAGNGVAGFSGDGGPATTKEMLNTPYGVAVDIFGNVFIADSNNNRIRKVTNTQGPALALNDVTPANSGNYQVVVTGPGGSVTSSAAILTVTTSPLIYGAIRNADGSLTLSFASPPHSTNIVLSTASLTPPVNWQPLSTNVAGFDGDWQYTDTNISSSSMRFYRSLKP